MERKLNELLDLYAEAVERRCQSEQSRDAQSGDEYKRFDSVVEWRRGEEQTARDRIEEQLREYATDLRAVRDGLEPARAFCESQATEANGWRAHDVVLPMRRALTLLARLVVAGMLLAGCALSHGTAPDAGAYQAPADDAGPAQVVLATSEAAAEAWEPPALDAGPPVGRWTWEAADGLLRCGWEGAPSPLPMDAETHWLRTTIWLEASDGARSAPLAWSVTSERCEAGALPRGWLNGCGPLAIETARAERGAGGAVDLEQTVLVVMPCGGDR